MTKITADLSHPQVERGPAHKILHRPLKGADQTRTAIGNVMKVPAEMDLSEFPYFPFHVRKFRDHPIMDSVSADELRAALLLWCTAWHQTPAATLPDDDKQLAKFAGYGRQVPAWRRVREGALFGFEPLGNGRLCHRELFELARIAWISKIHNRFARECDRVRKAWKRAGGTGAAPVPRFSVYVAEEFPETYNLWPMVWSQASPRVQRTNEFFLETAAGFPSENNLKGKGDE